MPRRIDPQPGLADAVRAFRRSAGMSQATLGSKAELHETWISHIESGRINPTWGNVRRLAQALGVSLGELADSAELNEGDLLTAIRQRSRSQRLRFRRVQRKRRPARARRRY
ncbi:MAG TPA: helix-turn-helix transcriptional regulator [Solirubrobacterales bacterium]|nr:helix-turn-helix transcriptional regulator [Solirubrobacterales bacterium]